MIHREPPCTPKISAFCDGIPPGEGWVEGEEETTVIRMGPVSWVAVQILPYYYGERGTANAEPTSEDTIDRVTPYAGLGNAVWDADFRKTLDEDLSGWQWQG